MFLDSQDRIWVGFDDGEWGGQLAQFDTQKKKFATLYVQGCSLDIFSWIGNDAANVKDVFEDANKNIYLASSIIHMGYIKGKITQFKDSIGYTVNPFPEINCDTTWFKPFDSIKPKNEEEEKKLEQVWDSLNNYIGSILYPYDIEERIYLGTGAYNPYDQRIYYYCDYGFFRQKDDQNMIRFYEPYLKPNLKWQFGLRHSVGYQMNVKKIRFLSKHEMLFLTDSQGIGYFDGKKVTYYR